MDKAEWLELRRHGLGGSDCPIVCGVSKYMTPFQLYLDKRGEAEQVHENEYMTWGNLLEPVIRNRYMEITGFDVAVPEGLVHHPRYSFMFFTPDGITKDRIVQIKTARTADEWGEPGTDEIPEAYLLQVTHEMSVAGKNLADLPVLFGGSDFRIYTVEKDPELEAIIIEREREFWNRVVTGNPPELTSLDDMKLAFGRKSQALVIQASDDMEKAVSTLRFLQNEKTHIEATEDKIKARVMKFMADADTLAAGAQTLCTWKMDKPGKQFSQARLKANYPNIYEECQEDKKPVRRFLLKKEVK